MSLVKHLAPIMVVLFLGLFVTVPQAGASAYAIVNQPDQIVLQCDLGDLNCHFSSPVIYANEAHFNGQPAALYNTTVWESDPGGYLSYVGFDGNLHEEGQSSTDRVYYPGEGPNLLVSVRPPQKVGTTYASFYIDGKVCTPNTTPPDCTFYGGKGLSFTIIVNAPMPSATPTTKPPLDPSMTPTPSPLLTQPSLTPSPTLTLTLTMPPITNTPTPTIDGDKSVRNNDHHEDLHHTNDEHQNTEDTHENNEENKVSTTTTKFFTRLLKLPITSNDSEISSPPQTETDKQKIIFDQEAAVEHVAHRELVIKNIIRKVFFFLPLWIAYL